MDKPIQPDRPVSNADYQAYLDERRKTISGILGLVGILGIIAIIGATIVLTTMVNAGVFSNG